jgi:hypothetical protein
VTQRTAPDVVGESADPTGPRFRQLLKRAMDTQGTEDDTAVTLEGFLAAGREQGLGEGRLRRAFGEWRERQQRVRSATAVEGSPIRMFLLGNDLSFVVPPRGPAGKLLVEAAAGLALVAVACLQCWVGSLVLPIWLLLPLPLAGLGYIGRALYRMALREEVFLTPEGGRIERSVGRLRWQVSFHTDAVTARIEEGLLSDSTRLKLESKESEKYVEEQTLLAGYDTEEKRWVASAINRWAGP